MPKYLDELSEFVEQTKYEDFSPEALAAVKDVTLDTLGVMVAGSGQSENASLGKLVAERSNSDKSTIFGLRLKAEPMMATLVNATAGVCLEMDEGNNLGGGHPAIHVIPGAIAVAEEMGASGRQLIESIIVGYEVGSRIGGAAKLRNGTNLETGKRWDVHPHGPYGTISTAAAVAKLKGYSSNQVTGAMNLAASMSPANTWTPCFEGATVRNLFSGRSGLQGILAVHVYECGYTGLEDGPTDILGSILGEQFDREAVVEGLQEGDYRIQKNYFKFHACCRINHPSLDAVLEACTGAEFALDDVEVVEINTPTINPGMMGAYPENMLSAKFNVPYAVAAAIVRNRTDVTSFFPEAISDGRIRNLAGKVNIQVNPEESETSVYSTLATAFIRLKDGRSLEGNTTIVRGDYGNRVLKEELVDKFHFLTDEIIGPKRAESIVNAVDRLEQIADIRELCALFND